MTGQRAGQTYQDTVAQHARAIAIPTQRGLLARWDNELCIGLVGAPQAQGRVLLERIADEAFAVGVRIGGPGCTPNLLVLVTNEADRAASDLRHHYPSVFITTERPERLLRGESQEALDRFLNSDRAVRSWHLSNLASSDGSPMLSVQLNPRDPSSVVPALSSMGSSRMASGFQEQFSRVFVIVDTTRLAGATYEQLAGYIAMTALAQVREEDFAGRLPTILSLFSDLGAGRTPQAGMTRWDRAYLRGLYEARSNAPSLVVQRGSIRRALESEGPPPEG